MKDILKEISETLKELVSVSKERLEIEKRAEIDSIDLGDDINK